MNLSDLFAGLVIAVLGFAASGHARAESVAGCDVWRFEKVQSVSVKDLGTMSKAETIKGSTGTIQVSWFDYEDHPSHGKWHAVAFLSARIGDLGETPVAGLLWSTVTSHGVEKKDGANDSVSTTFVQTNGQRSCPPFVVALQPDGIVTANGRIVGVVK